MKLAYLSFTEKGFALAKTLADTLGGSAMRCGQPDSLHEWTKKQFSQADGLIFVGAVGIAVRAIAPYLQKKWKDPAVVAIDETAQFAIPLVSGHLGGANSLARAISAVCGAQAVITTATDVNGVFAVDDWARCQGLCVADPEHIRIISGQLLAGTSIRLSSRWPIDGECPQGVELTEDTDADVVVSAWKEGKPVLSLVPKVAVLGIGCRKGIGEDVQEKVLQRFLDETGLQIEAICEVASIDLKKEEDGLIAFCRAHEWPFTTCSAQQLQNVPGEFTASAFVSEVTGVDNVCERSAVLVSGGSLCHKKFACEGVTMAAALKPFFLDWNRMDICPQNSLKEDD